MSSRPEHLPPGLTATVGDVEEELGHALAAAGGAAIFEAVEDVRRCMVRYREGERPDEREEALDLAEATLDALATELDWMHEAWHAWRPGTLAIQRP